MAISKILRRARVSTGILSVIYAIDGVRNITQGETLIAMIGILASVMVAYDFTKISEAIKKVDNDEGN